jgi:hypothetical protein
MFCGAFQVMEKAGPCPIEPDGTANAWNPQRGRDAWNVPLAIGSRGGTPAKGMNA